MRGTVYFRICAIIHGHSPTTVLAAHKLKQEQRRSAICVFLAVHSRSYSSDKQKLQGGAIKGAANTFNVSVSTIKKIQRRHKSGTITHEKHKLNVRRKKGSGGKFKLNPNDVKTRVKVAPFSLRKLLRSLSSQMGIPVTSLFCYLKLGVLGKDGSAVKPTLTPANKVARVEYCKRFVDTYGCFEPMLDWLNIGKKWRFLNKKAAHTASFLV